jgi:hypothetical protein
MLEMIPASVKLSAGKVIVERVIKEALDRAGSIDSILRDEFKICGRDITIQCPESIQNYSITFESKKGLFSSNKKRFKFGSVRRVSIRPVRSLQPLYDAISLTSNGFEIELSKLEPNELYMLDAEYYIDDPKFIDSLVYKKVAKEIPTEDSKEYWIMAQMKQLKTLQQEFGNIELRDIDFGVDVSISQDIKMKVPKVFNEQIDTIVALTKKHGRSEKEKLLRSLLVQQNKKYSGKELDILRELQKLFLASKFRDFVDVKKDFHYSDCIRGVDIYGTLPFPTWPKSMKVICRTDLNFNEPATDGILVYKKKGFTNELDKIFK